jgi:acetyl-CoA/propionyl-CoA carboxylase biotin carboxyl carrier protein
VFVDGDTVGVGDGEPARARLVRDGLVRDGASVRLQLADRSVSATVLREGNQIWISLGRAAFELSTVSPEQQLADHRAGLDRVGGSASPDIRTPMPGTVVAVSANTGETVAEGQLLVTIEAMKMEHKMLASTAGVVTIDVQTGDLVGLDQVVARISPHEGAAA